MSRCSIDQYARDGRVQVQDLGRDGLLARKAEQLAGQVGRANRRLAHLQDVGMELLVRIHLLERQLRMPEDHAEHVVEVVGDAARQPADGFHLPGLLKLGLQHGILLRRARAHGQVMK